VANTALAWERTNVTNFGIDFSLFNRRISGAIDLYYKDTRDLIGSVQLNPWTGRTSLTGNIGQLINKGAELSLRSENIRTNNFSWSTSFTFAYNWNKLVSYSVINPALNTASSRVGLGSGIAGYNLSALFAYRFAGLDNLGDPLIYLNNKTTTKAPNVAQVNDVVYMGTTQAPFYGGLSNTFTYKNLSLSLNTIYNMGGVMRRDVNGLYGGRWPTSTSFGGQNQQVYFLDRWKKPGDEAFTNIPSYVSSSSVNFTRRNTAYYTSGDINVISSSYLKLRDITLNYTLPAGTVRTLKLQRASVFAQATNFMLWRANKFGIDPEVPRGQGAVYPAHTFSLGVNLSL
jgi:hypothetical protein